MEPQHSACNSTSLLTQLPSAPRTEGNDWSQANFRGSVLCPSPHDHSAGCPSPEGTDEELKKRWFAGKVKESSGCHCLVPRVLEAIHLHTHTYTHTFTHSHTHPHTLIHIHTPTHTHAHPPKPHTHSCTLTHLQTYPHTFTHTLNILTYIYTYTQPPHSRFPHTLIHTYTLRYTCTCTCQGGFLASLPSPLTPPLPRAGTWRILTVEK